MVRGRRPATTLPATIRVVSRSAARRSAVRDLGRRPWPVKDGAYYLVQEVQTFAVKPSHPEFTPLPSRDLDGFPGALLTRGGG